MQLGMVGLGRMGANIVRRLMRDGHECIVYDVSEAAVAHLEGEGAIATMRSTIGATDPAKAAPGTIRGDLAVSMPDNLVHGSDSPESAQRELALWFG